MKEGNDRSQNFYINFRGLFVIVLCLVVLGIIQWKFGLSISAEQSGNSPESGTSSRLKSLSTELSNLGFGSTDSGSWGDWGSDWNRIYSASIWTPSDATATTADVASGKTFYAGNNRVKQTGKELTEDPPTPITPTVGDASYFNTLYKAIDTLSYGSESTGSWGNWGLMWNRIYSSATWTPSDATATVNDVKAGETFYAGNNNRTLQTGTNLGAGDGSDGSLTLTSTINLNIENVGSSSDDNGSYADGIAYRVSGISGSTITTTTDAPGLVADDKIILVDMQGTSSDYGSVGNYEELTVSSVSSDTINLTSSPTKDYDGSTNSYSDQIVIIQRVPQYSNVTINSGGQITASAWDGTATTPTGNSGFYTGLVAFFVDGDLTINVGGSINATGLGYRGGTLSSPGYNWGGDGFVGESIDGGYQNIQSDSANLGAGGAGLYGGGGGGTTPGGAGGSLGSAGTDGSLGGHGIAGSINGDSSKLLLGSAGGGGAGWIGSGSDWMYSKGGNGGGSIYVAASNFVNNGIINTNGLAGEDSRYRYSGFGGSGGGSGGTVFIQTWIYANNATITSVGANGNYGSNSNFSAGDGGNGGDGRINVVVGSYLTTTSSYASGGTITYSDGYYIHTFTTDGTFTPTSSRNVEVLVVAGGGGGGSSRSSYGGGGGGGAGGLIYNSSYSVSSGTPISVTIGNGGSGGSNNGSQKGGNGGDSVFGSLTAIGGGAGGSGTLDVPNIGGSGGGGGYWMYSYEAGADGTSGQGYAGGGNGATAGAGGGGGGGAGSTGYIPSNIPLHNGGIGGIGLEYNISGTSVYYAGGGCGGSYCIGGLGGGGANILNRPLDGLVNRGGGGAGAYAEAGKAGDGGSGVVIIRYQP